MSARRVYLTPASRITPERVEWLWEGRVPRNSLTLLAGEPGLGKSTQTIELAARITRGELPGGLLGKPRDVLLASAEDHFAGVVAGRLRAANADLERVYRLDVADTDGEAMLTLPDDVGRIEAECSRLDVEGRPVALVVVDPITAFIPSNVDTHKDAAVRRVLSPLGRLAEAQGLAVVAVMHLNKDQSAKALSRVGGSVAFAAAARSALVFARHPDDPDGEQGAERVVVHAKSNYGTYAPTLGARIESSPVAGIGDVARLIVIGECPDIGTDDLRANKADNDGGDCEQAILSAVAAGARPSHDVKAEVAAGQGCSRRTVERAAKSLVRRGELAITDREFPRRTFWAVATGQGVATEDGATAESRMNTAHPAPDPSQSRQSPDADATALNGHREFDAEQAALALGVNPNDEPMWRDA
jgi:hypothetical protein